MQVKDIIHHLDLTVYTGDNNLNNEVTGGYCSDLLSDVIGNAERNMVWITMQYHKNIVAVAALKEVAAIIIVNNHKPDNEVIEASRNEGIPLLSTSFPAFEVAGKIYQLLR